MLWKKRWIAVAALLAGLTMALGAGCSKYDTLERNMQYVSDDLLHRDAQAAWENVSAAHERWRAAGGGHEAGSETYVAYQDAYAKYAVIYNELLDRQNGSFTGHLRGATDVLPPSPPGMNVSAPQKPVPSAPAAAPTPASGASAPAPRQLNDAAPTNSTSGVPMGMAAPLPAATPAKAAAKRPAAAEAPAGGDRYIVATGDTLRLIAKRHGISEKALMEANGITDPDKIAAGKTLTIPAR